MCDLNKIFQLTFGEFMIDANFPEILIQEYERFLMIRFDDKKCRAPNYILKLWKTHILNTCFYYDYCIQKFGGIIHSDLTEFMNDSLTNDIKYTMDKMVERFNDELDLRIWNVITCESCKQCKITTETHFCDNCSKLTVCANCSVATLKCPVCNCDIAFGILVKTIGRKIITINGLKQSSLVIDIKQKIQDKEGIPTKQLRLLHNGIEFDNAQTLAYYELQHLSVIHLVLDCKGC